MQERDLGQENTSYCPYFRGVLLERFHFIDPIMIHATFIIIVVCCYCCLFTKLSSGEISLKLVAKGKHMKYTFYFSEISELKVRIYSFVSTDDVMVM